MSLLYFTIFQGDTDEGKPEKKYPKYSKKVTIGRRDVSPERCDICAKKFSLRMDMMDHKKEVHKTGIDIYRCRL